MRAVIEGNKMVLIRLEACQNILADDLKTIAEYESLDWDFSKQPKCIQSIMASGLNNIQDRIKRTKELIELIQYDLNE